MTLFEQVIGVLDIAYVGWRVKDSKAFMVETGDHFDHVFTVTESNHKVVLVDVAYNTDEKTPLTKNIMVVDGDAVDVIVRAIINYVYENEDDWNWGRTDIWPVETVIEKSPETGCDVDYYVLK